MGKLLEYEIKALKAYLDLPTRKLLNHEFEQKEDFLAGHVFRIYKRGKIR